MNIFHKVALQSMKKSRTRTFVTVIGVVLSVAMLTSVVTFAVSLLNYMVNGAEQKYGGWHVAFLDVDSAFAEDRIHDGEVSGAAVLENIGYAVLEGGENPHKPYLFLAGFREETFAALPIHLVSGRLPETSAEVLVPAHVAANGGVRHAVGDTLSLAVGSRTSGDGSLGQHDPYRMGNEYGAQAESFVPNAGKTFTVVGICERPAFEESTAPGYTLITVADPDDPADSAVVFVTLAKPRRAQTYAEGAAGGHSYLLNDNVLRFMGASNDTVFRALLYAVGGILIALIVTGSVFLIYNAFTISLNERTRQFGILSSVGATQRQLQNSVLFEGVCIGAMGIPFGVLAGVGGIGLVIPIVAGNFAAFAYSDVPLTLSVSAPAIVAAALIGMVTILISAYIPARKAAGAPVMESIRQTASVKIEPKAVKTSMLAERMYGLEGTLALKNFKRNQKRYRSTILSLVLSVVLFVSASAFGIYLQQGAEQSLVEADGDILFDTRVMEEGELLRLYETLRTADGVTKSTYQAISTYSCQVDPGDLTSAFLESYRNAAGLDVLGNPVELKLDIQFIEDDIYRDFLESLGLPAAEYTGQEANMMIVGKQPGGIDLFAHRYMDFTLAAQSGEGTTTIHTTFVDTYPLDPPPAELSEVKGYVFMAVAPYAMKPQFDPLGAPTKLGLTFWSENPGLTTAMMQAMIERAGVPSGYALYNVHRILEENRSILFVVNVFTYVFVIMISLIAVANVFNTVSTNIKLRRRELAMLRSVGMSARDFNRMMHFECAIYGTRALLWGLPLAGILSRLIYRGLVAGGADIAFSLPWGSIAASVCSVFLVVFVTMLYAVRKLKSENIIDALRDDMT